jgi:lysozyme family protein
MQSSFESSLKFVLGHENVYAKGHYGDYNYVECENVSGDSGGLTKFGIDQASHPHVDIKALDYAGARQIYHDEEWTKCRCDDLPAGLDAAVFDIAVNNGMGTSILLLQRALNKSGANPLLAEDGQIGSKTVFCAQHAERSELLEHLLSLREQRYHDIVAANPSQNKFLNGWLDRNVDLATFVIDVLPA